MLLVLASSQVAAYGCTCVADSLGKRYRRAKAVFIGQAVDPRGQQPDVRLIQGDRDQTVEVIRSWKGVKKRFVSVSFERQLKPGNCPVLYYLEPGKQYLVFAYGAELEVQSVCSDTWEIPQNETSPMYDIAQANLRKLNSVWFRFWSRLKLN